MENFCELEQGKKGGLLLDTYKNNSHYNNNNTKNKTKKTCPRARYYCEFVVHDEEKEKLVRSITGCKKWSCEVCGPMNAMKLRKKTKNGTKEMIKKIRKGFREQYFYKLLTLTVPGKGFRAKYTPDEAEVIMKKNWDKLNRALQKKYGKFDYIWCYEPQGDGYPHMHVFLIGEAIAPRKILLDIRNLWWKKYGMGFVKLNKMDNIDRAIWYITKYMTKGLESGRKHSRVYSMSRDLRKECKLKLPPITIIEYGYLDYDLDGNKIYTPIYINDGDQKIKLNPKARDKILEELCDWFEEKGSYKQMSIFN